MVIFEQEHRGKVWRLESTVWNGEPRLQVWPWFQPKNGGELRPGADRFGGGFPVPVDRVPELIAALQSIKRELG